MTWTSLSEGIAQVRREMSARERRDVTPEEIADAVGVTPAAYSRWVKAERTPNEDAVQKLSAFFGVTPAYLRYGVEPRQAATAQEPVALTDASLDEAIAKSDARKAAKKAATKAAATGGARGGRRPPGPRGRGSR